jgi:stage V sporulation protein SpoVS
MRPNSRTATLCAALAALALLSSCASRDPGAKPAPPASTSAAATTTTTGAVPSAAADPQAKNWFDLKVGDCLTEIPAIDAGAITATVVDCTTPHQAEVYLLAPLAVNTAVDEIASEKCAEGFVAYTGQAFNGSPLVVTYLIDSNQDRTANNPTPSTAICFLQAANGGPLTKSARV